MFACPESAASSCAASCRAVRQRASIVLVSGTRIEALDRSAGLLIGGDDFLIKPVDPNELLARVRRLVARSRRRRIVPASPRLGLTKRELAVLERLALRAAPDRHRGRARHQPEDRCKPRPAHPHEVGRSQRCTGGRVRLREQPPRSGNASNARNPSRLPGCWFECIRVAAYGNTNWAKRLRPGQPNEMCSDVPSHVTSATTTTSATIAIVRRRGTLRSS